LFVQFVLAGSLGLFPNMLGLGSIVYTKV